MRILIMVAIATLTLATAKTTMVEDPRYSLMWEDTVHVKEEKVTFKEAQGYCLSLKLGTFTNWRVPTLAELLTIVDYKRHNPAILKEFTFLDRDTMYWTITPYAGDKGSYWGVNFEDGATDNASAIYNRYVRCVRDTFVDAKPTK